MPLILIKETNMAIKIETRPKALQRQQMILTVLGYYQGSCDGIWSVETIAAMRKFEASGKFAPALPRNGLPLDLNSKMPPGVYRDTVTAVPGAGLLTCAGLDKAKIVELTPNSNSEPDANAGTVIPPSTDTNKDVDANKGDTGNADADKVNVGNDNTPPDDGEVEFSNINKDQQSQTPKLSKAERKALNKQKHQQQQNQNS